MTGVTPLSACGHAQAGTYCGFPASLPRRPGQAHYLLARCAQASRFRALWQPPCLCVPHADREVIVQMLPACALRAGKMAHSSLMGSDLPARSAQAGQPSLHQGSHSVAQRQEIVPHGTILTHDLMKVAELLQSIVSFPAPESVALLSHWRLSACDAQAGHSFDWSPTRWRETTKPVVFSSLQRWFQQ